MDIVVSNKASRPLYEQISFQIKAAIMSGELKAGDAIPSVRSLAKSLHISILTVQKAYASLQEDGFIETTAGKGCYVSAQNQEFYLEEQQKKNRGKVWRSNRDRPCQRNLSGAADRLADTHVSGG